MRGLSHVPVLALGKFSGRAAVKRLESGSSAGLRKEHMNWVRFTLQEVNCRKGREGAVLVT